MFELSFTLAGRVVPKARPKYHGNQCYLPKPYRDWRESAEQELQSLVANAELSAVLPIERAIVTITLLGSHRGDADNLAGAILDALVSAGVLVDDRLSCIPCLTIAHNPSSETKAVIVVEPIAHLVEVEHELVTDT